MGAIGDYIHYSSANYRKFGTSKEGSSDYNSAQSIFEAQRQKMLSNIFKTEVLPSVLTTQTFHLGFCLF